MYCTHVYIIQVKILMQASSLVNSSLFKSWQLDQGMIGFMLGKYNCRSEQYGPWASLEKLFKQIEMFPTLFQEKSKCWNLAQLSFLLAFIFCFIDNWGGLIHLIFQSWSLFFLIPCTGLFNHSEPMSYNASYW